MALLKTNNGSIYYRLQGRDGAPAIVFAHSLGCDHGQWDPQAAALQDRFLVLRYDLRGHGGSEATPGDYTMAMLGADVIALTDALGIRRFAFCGLSIGGMIGQWLGAHYGDRIEKLILANTSARFADPHLMEERRAAVLMEGMQAVAEASTGRFFSPGAVAAELPHVATVRRTIVSTNPVGYAGCCAAIRDMDQVSLLREIRVPALVISSGKDPSTPWKENGEVIEKAIPGAKGLMLAGFHLSNLEQPEKFTAAVLDFLEK